jgi:phosphoribosylglycinamide formyltransferase 1
MTLDLGVLASHGGSNLQAIIDACRAGTLDARINVVISNNAGSQAMTRAIAAGIPAYHLSSSTHPDPRALDRAIAEILATLGVRIVVLAGYMRKVGPAVLGRFPGRILNIHPALLPKHGGVGMYGRRVHEAVLEAGEELTGITIHVVDEEYDHGPIVNQCTIPVLPGDTADTLSIRVLEREHRFYVETLQGIASGAVDFEVGAE